MPARPENVLDVVAHVVARIQTVAINGGSSVSDEGHRDDTGPKAFAAKKGLFGSARGTRGVLKLVNGVGPGNRRHNLGRGRQGQKSQPNQGRSEDAFVKGK